MNKLIAGLLCLLLTTMPVYAFAEDFPDVPFLDPFENRDDDDFSDFNAPAGQYIEITVDGKALQLGYDSSPEYSNVEDGIVQASFYTYGADDDTLYELYMMFPETVQPGMIITPDYAALTNSDCSVVLIISDENDEKYYFSGLMDGSVYPESSYFSIHFDAVSGGRYSGTLDAELVAMNLSSGEPEATLRIESAPFSFSMGDDSAEHRNEPLPTDAPKDMRKV